MSKPFTLGMPDVGLKIVQSIEIVVVLPAPFGPSKPKTSPFSTVILSLSTAVRLLNRLVRSIVSMVLCISSFCAPCSTVSRASGSGLEKYLAL